MGRNQAWVYQSTLDPSSCSFFAPDTYCSHSLSTWPCTWNSLISCSFMTLFAFPKCTSAQYLALRRSTRLHYKMCWPTWHTPRQFVVPSSCQKVMEQTHWWLSSKEPAQSCFSHTPRRRLPECTASSSCLHRTASASASLHRESHRRVAAAGSSQPGSSHRDLWWLQLCRGFHVWLFGALLGRLGFEDGIPRCRSRLCVWFHWRRRWAAGGSCGRSWRGERRDSTG